MSPSAETYLCTTCGWIYDPEQGDPDGGIAPGTPWESIPDDWVCPVCGVGKADFEPATERHPVPQGQLTLPAPGIVVVGSGLAGYGLAKELRKRDSSLPILVLTADGGEVYTKPMLSVALARRQTPDDLVQKDAATMARDLAIEIRTRTRILSIDRNTRTLAVDGPGGPGQVRYDRLVLALGADPRVFPAPGSDSVPIATVNDLDDYRAWRGRIAPGERVLLIGAGLIGCEFANDLAATGYGVSLVDPAPRPLARLLPEAIGTRLAEALAGIGCALHLGRTVARYKQAETGFVAELDDGTRVPFDHALSAVGLAPRTALAKAAGLDVGVGILVDRLMRTSDPAIFALGDCVQTPAGPLPYIAPLLAQARAIAATLTGAETALVLPAMPVVVKTPALPIALCPPPAGSAGTWEQALGEGEATALFRAPDGRAIGFALAGAATARQHALAREMPDMLPEERAPAPPPAAAGTTRWECRQCGHVYDPAEGDPDSGIPPGTPWEAVPEDWCCPLCGAGKDAFDPLL